MKKVARRTAP